MNPIVWILFLNSPYFFVEAQITPQQTDGALTTEEQQQPVPATQTPAAAPQQGASPGQQPAPGAQPGSSNVASTLHVYAYPKAKQSSEKQAQDETECYQSAQTATSGPSGQQQGQQQGQPGTPGQGATVKGSAGGAATGAAIGAAAGDAGKGAAVGAASGAAVGHRRKKKAEKEAKKEQQQQQQAQQAQTVDNLKRAYTACMESRNYTVK